MSINYPNALLHSLRLNPEICQPLSVNVYEVKSGDGAVCTLKLRAGICAKETCVNVKNSTTLLISNLVLVFQINFQAVFHCDCAKNLMRNVGNY